MIGLEPRELPSPTPYGNGAIGPPTALGRIRMLEGRLADVAMLAQQLHLQYGGNRRGETVATSVVTKEFRDLRDWMRQDPAARDKPPMFRSQRDVRGPDRNVMTRQRRRALARKAG